MVSPVHSLKVFQLSPDVKFPPYPTVNNLKPFS